MDEAPNQIPENSAAWKPVQTYALATICLLIGLAIGYFLRGSASPAPPPASPEAVAQDPHAGMGQQGMPSLDQMKMMADKQAEPLLAKLKTNPNDAETLNQIGTLYRATHQFKTAIDYYQKSLDINPKNVGARTDLASCLYYMGDVDGALAQLDKSLTYDPKHTGTLVNIGIIRWKGKNDVKGAVAAWQQALKLNPDPQSKKLIEHMLVQVKEQKQKAVSITGVTG
jgi:cytochrome c-type biogenesis protein CcmH/NrfG